MAASPSIQNSKPTQLRTASGGEFRGGESIEGLYKAQKRVIYSAIYQVQKALQSGSFFKYLQDQMTFNRVLYGPIEIIINRILHMATIVALKVLKPTTGDKPVLATTRGFWLQKP